MTKSATEVMQDVLVAAVLDALAALKAASKGVPNTMLRDINAIHANTTFADLPKDVQDAIGANVRASLTRLLKEGYAIAPRDAAPPRPASPGGQPQFRRDPRPGGRPGGPRRNGEGRPPRRPDGGKPGKPRR
jgi:hypothetical protein